jgi:hypothetical protein
VAARRDHWTFFGIATSRPAINTTNAVMRRRSREVRECLGSDRSTPLTDRPDAGAAGEREQDDAHEPDRHGSLPKTRVEIGILYGIFVICKVGGDDAMSWRNRMAIIVFTTGTILSVAWAYRGVRDVLRLLDTGGGIFGSSNGIGLLGYVLPVFGTFLLSNRIRSRGRTEQTFRECYLFATLTLVTILAVSVAQAFRIRPFFGDGVLGWAFFVASFFAVALWLPVQAFFAAGFVGLLIRRRTAIG